MADTCTAPSPSEVTACAWSSPEANAAWNREFFAGLEAAARERARLAPEPPEWVKRCTANAPRQPWRPSLPWKEWPQCNPLPLGHSDNGSLRPSREIDALTVPTTETGPFGLYGQGFTAPARERSPVPEAVRPLRKRMWTLRQGLRSLQRPRIACCGRATIGNGADNACGGGVAVKLDRANDRVYLSGVQNCGSIWECPACAMRISAVRSEEVRTVVEQHGRDRVVMLTLTVRHAMGDDLRQHGEGLSNAYRALTRGAPWKRFMRSIGIQGSIRGLEVTHGINGWHAHLHILLLLDRPVQDAERIMVELSDGRVRERWMPIREGFIPERANPRRSTDPVGWLIDRWQTMVERYIGPEHVPDFEHGIELTAGVSDDYIAKLGLELTDPGRKAGRRGGRTPWQIASDYTDSPNERDRILWQTYCAAMKGRRKLTWSRGVRKHFGLNPDLQDEDICDLEEKPEHPEICRVSLQDWLLLRDTRVNGYAFAAVLVDTAAREGGTEAIRLVERLRARHLPREVIQCPNEGNTSPGAARNVVGRLPSVSP